MGILGKEYICPELECPNIEEGKKGQICPVCGTEYKKMASFQANNLRTFKQMNQGKQNENVQSKIEEQQNKKVISQNISYSDEMSDEEIKAKIYTDLDNLAKKEADIDWTGLESLLSSDSDLQIGLKAIIDQNKLIILQNELIYRELKKLNDESC